MRLTQEEARKWAEILKGFSEGKRYQIPYWYKDNGEVGEYGEITDFKVNSQYPTIEMCYDRCGQEPIRPDDIIEVSKNYTIEQNSGENRIEGGVVSISGSVDTFRCWKCGRILPISERTDLAYMSNPPKYACKECEGIEKGKQYRPFKDCSELINTCGSKLIWVKSKAYGVDNLITAFDNDNESIGGSCVFLQDAWFDMQELFDNFTFLDGSQCGISE